MRTKEILKALHGIKLCLMAHPDNEENSEFEIRINQIEEIEESIPKYADEQTCAFAEWIIESKYKLISIKKGIIYSNEDIIKPEYVIEFYTTTELLEIFKKEINGKV